MYLKRLELLGFKSFASKTVLELDRGMTAIVGPNGSGKSNVVDAVRWALGEQSLRAVRSRKSEEVIFAGNARRPAVGMAEVTLVLDNSEGQLPVPFAEVSITRRQYRSGDGEYLINKARVRLRDVVELLSHAGLGPGAYAVVGQGAVDELLLQRPEERRALLETAADISRYQLRLRECQDKLTETEANIQRAEDIRAEIAPRLSKLRVQANRARRYEELRGRLQQLLLYQYVLDIRNGQERLAAERERAESCLRAADGAASALDDSRVRLARLRELLKAEELALEAARDRLNELRLARAKREREAALAQEREASLSRQLSQAQDELASTRREQEELKAELERLAEERSGLAASLDSIRARIEPAESERRRAVSERRLLQAQLEKLYDEQRAVASRRAELQERRATLMREARKADTARAESLEAARQSAEQLAELEARVSAVQQELDRLRSRLAEREARHAETQQRLKGLGKQLEAARQEERAAWERHNDLKNRLALLAALRDEHRGIPSGAKAILEAGLQGIRGTLASMIEVSDRYVTAVSAALGRAQSYVVCEGFSEGLKALHFLSSHPGRATIAPLRLDERGASRHAVTEFRSRLNGLLDGISFHGLAADLVSCAPEAEELCARYLGLSLVVEQISDAVELYRRLVSASDGSVPFQVVTLDGQLLRARGDLVSSANGEKDSSLLGRETEIRLLSESVAEAEAALKAARDVVAGLERARASLSQEAAADASAMASLQREMGRLGAAGTELASQIAKMEAAVEWHRSRAAAAERETAQSQAALSKTERELSDLATRERDGRDRIEQLEADLAAQEAVVAEAVAGVSRLQSEGHAVQGRLRELEARAAALSEALQRAIERVRWHEEKIAQLSQARDQLARSEQAEFPAALVEELETLEKLLAERSARIAELRGEQAAAEAEQARLAGALEAAREELAKARSRAERATAELGALLREAARETGVELPTSPTGDESEQSDPQVALLREAADALEALAKPLAEMSMEGLPESSAVASAQVDAIRREMQSLGTINAEAPEEYRLISERHAFLTAQLDDLRHAERTLRKAIDELKHVMEVRFQETFDQVNAEFGRCFTTLFGGGSARLVLSQAESLLNGGVEVVATPPGRKSGSLLGLSGGERALTAVAFLFALMRVHPSPFCVLDEVDAALDESNVQRFCAMIRDLSSSTQFVLITHNRTTMEMASALYGVSMSPESTSRVVSLRLASKEQPH